MKILIMKFRHIGDVLLTSPMANALATLTPKPQVTFLVKKGTEAMLTGHPHIHQVLVWPEKEPTESRLSCLKRQYAFIRQLRAERFDISINTTEGDRGLLIGWFSGAKQRLGYLKDKQKEKWWRKLLVNSPKYPREGRFHTVLRNLDLITDWVTPNHIHVDFYYSANDKMVLEQKLQQAGWNGTQSIVHVHPVSRWLFKCCRDDYMAQTIDHIQQQLGHQVVLTCAPEATELEKLNRIIQHCRTQPLNLGGQLSLKQTGALSALADFFLGVDSAPMHMAAAVDTPVIAILGPSGAFDWGPWPNGWTEMNSNPYPKKNGYQQVGKHCVIQQDWACAPCGQAGCDNLRKSRCLEEMHKNIVIHQLH